MFSSFTQSTLAASGSKTSSLPLFHDKAFIVTGCSSPLGRAIALHLAQHGANLALCDGDRDPASSLLQELGDMSDALPSELAFHFVFSCFDALDPSAVQRFVNSVFKKYTGLTGLVCCTEPAASYTSFEDIDMQSYDRSMGQVKRVFLFNQSFVSNVLVLRQHIPAPTGGYSIVNIGSVYGKTGGSVAESAAKHAIHGLTKSVAKEHGKSSIRANVVAPGLFETPTLQRLTQGAVDPTFLPMKRVASHQEVATCVKFLLSNESSYMTGTEQLLDGGWLA